MSNATRSIPPVLALAASLLGLALGGSSTLDYAAHLDRQMHGIHCGFVPGMSEAETAATGCRTAMFSTYSAVLRDQYWGGIPIALFAMGAFAFFGAFAIYLLVAGRDAPRKAPWFLGTIGLTPAMVSAGMAYIAATKLGEFCHTCIGIYIASGLLALSGLLAIVMDRRDRSPAEVPRVPAGGLSPTLVDDPPSRPARRSGSAVLVLAWLAALGFSTAVPAAIYASSLPSYASYLGSCGKLPLAPEADVAIHLGLPGAKQPATLFVDPLCPTCKAFHKRLVTEGVYDQLDTQLVLFPLDNACNWMLDRALHPGACVVSKAILCADDKAGLVLEWSYEHQEEVLETAKANNGDGAEGRVVSLIGSRFPGLDACVTSKETGRRLDKILRYIAKTQLPVSTPQLFLGETRLCDEDSDIGFAFTISKLAPEVTLR